MKTIRQIDLEGLKQIFHDHIRKTFPVNEIRPYHSVTRLYNEGRYVSYGYYEADRLLGYACFALVKDDPYALMDYLEIVPELRGHGLGTAFLEALRPYLPGEDGVFIEAEVPASADTAEEQAIRERRIQFYLRNGARETKTGCRLFGVDYHILLLPKPEIDFSESAFYEAVDDFYRDIYRSVYGRLCKTYMADSPSV